ncbi:dTDP-4-dehydrorhamnose 3,5-epimerase family protein [Rheinheimera texasensis]|uniref:dTDP-4-dehydrorhamnose 3,5-epimerase family protein n=1 Tax=Rheinheimera texasensis TaxID=306205 RepID=UPI00068DE7DE|nr:dTDP-4-dehydrorhamnose 3,5-epimerase family protein [Rheinheimera texasensis]
MQFNQLQIHGSYLIESSPFADSRGVFRRSFCMTEFQQAGVSFQIRQTNISENFACNTLRGFHFQMAPFGEDKIMTPVSGRFFNVTIDLRPDSPTFLTQQTIQLNSEARHALLIPKGCANAFLTLAPDSTMLYYMSELYSPSHYYGFRWNDPLVNVDWPAQPISISEKDQQYADFDLSTYLALYSRTNGQQR